MSQSYYKKIVGQLSLKVIIKVTVVTYFAFTLGNIFNNLFPGTHPATGGLWSVASAMIIIYEIKNKLIKTASNRVLGTLIGATCSGIYLSLFGANEFTITISIASTVAVCQVIKLAELSKIACVTVAVIMFISNLYPEFNPWLNAFLRVCEAAIGASVAVVVAYALRIIHDDKT